MKAIVKLFILIFVLVNITKAQVILPMGLGQKNSLNITCSDGDKMWVVNNIDEKFVVNKWDGSFWIEYPEIPIVFLNTISTVPQSIEAKAIYFYNNELYLALANKFNEKLLLIKTSGRKWEVINTTSINVSNNLTFLSTSDGLMLCGKITVDTQLISILKINQTDCAVYAGLSANHSANDYFTDFEYTNGTIWAFGQFTLNKESRYFAKLDNGNWTIPSSPKAPFGNGNIAIGKYQGKLVMAGVNFDGVTSFAVQNDSFWPEKRLSEEWKINSISDFREIGNNLWAAGQFTNIKTSKSASLAMWDGTKWFLPDFDYTDLGNDLKLNGKDVLMISGNFVKHQDLLLNHTGILDLGNAVIAGKVFNDVNGNCTQDFGENNMSGIVIGIASPSIKDILYITTDYNGRYYFPVTANPSSYMVTLVLPKYMEGTCGNNIKPVSISSKLTMADIDFGIVANGMHLDAATSVFDFTGWRARQGYTENYKICAENKGTQKIESGKLVFKSDERLTKWVFSEQPLTLQNNTAEWNIKSLLVGERYCINGNARIPITIPLESEIIFDSKIIVGDLTDEEPTNNISILKQKIVAAIDPNDKTTKQNYLIQDTTTQITYKIRFQNQGNYVAENISIRDTIDPNLVGLGPKGTIEDASHEMINTAHDLIRLPNGTYIRVYTWLFPKIWLPDSKTNEEGSHGYLNFTYNLSPKSPLHVGTKIHNQAFIYFDYQEAIITNIASNLVSNESGIKPVLPLNQLSIYPNPANDYIYVSNPLKSEVRFNIINSLGQIVLTKTIAADSKLSISTGYMARGLYLMQAEGFAPVKVIIN